MPPPLPRPPPRPRAEGNGAGREQAQPRERTTSGRRAAGVERGRGDGGQYGPVNRSAVAAAWGVGVVAGRRKEGGERGRAGGACWRGVLEGRPGRIGAGGTRRGVRVGVD